MVAGPLTERKPNDLLSINPATMPAGSCMVMGAPVSTICQAPDWLGCDQALASPPKRAAAATVLDGQSTSFVPRGGKLPWSTCSGADFMKAGFTASGRELSACSCEDDWLPVERFSRPCWS